jgi:hypothetical protein
MENYYYNRPSSVRGVSPLPLANSISSVSMMPRAITPIASVPPVSSPAFSSTVRYPVSIPSVPLVPSMTLDYSPRSGKVVNTPPIYSPGINSMIKSKKSASPPIVSNYSPPRSEVVVETPTVYSPGIDSMIKSKRSGSSPTSDIYIPPFTMENVPEKEAGYCPNPPSKVSSVSRRSPRILPRKLNFENVKREIEEEEEEQEFEDFQEFKRLKEFEKEYSPRGSRYSPGRYRYSPRGNRYSPGGRRYSPRGGMYSPRGTRYSPDKYMTSPNISSPYRERRGMSMKNRYDE